MQERGRQIARRLADAADLLIDFATLGEYGLEYPVEQPQCRPGRRRTNRMIEQPSAGAGLVAGRH
jgi:hypothetical protein